jgi:hypothetical protein
MPTEGAKHRVEMPWPLRSNKLVSRHRSYRVHRKLAGTVLYERFAAKMLKRSSDRYNLSGADLAPTVGYPARKAYHTAKLVQSRQRYKEAEGRPLTETHEDDPTRVDATMDLSLDPCFHIGNRGCYGSFVPLITGRRKRSNIEPTWTVLARI